MDEGGKGVNQTLIVKDHNSLKITRQNWHKSCSNLFASYISLTFLIKRPKSQIMEKPNLKCHLAFFFLSPTVCVHLTDKNHSDIDCQVDLKPQKEPLYTQVVRISIKTDMTTAALSISKMWWRDYGNASQKGSWVHGHSFWFHARGWGGVLVKISSWSWNPLYWKKCLELHIFIIT